MDGAIIGMGITALAMSNAMSPASPADKPFSRFVPGMSLYEAIADTAAIATGIIYCFNGVPLDEWLSEAPEVA